MNNKTKVPLLVFMAITAFTMSLILYCNLSTILFYSNNLKHIKEIRYAVFGIMMLVFFIITTTANRIGRKQRKGSRS